MAIQEPIDGQLSTGITAPTISPAIVSPLIKTMLPVPTPPISAVPVEETLTTTPGSDLPLSTQSTASAQTSVQVSILDDATHNYIFGATVTLLDANGNPKAPAVTLAPDSNTFTTWTAAPDESAVLVQKSGYLDTMVAFNDLLYSPIVYLVKGTSSPSYTWALLLLVPLLLMGKKKKGSKVSGIEPSTVSTILLIAGAVLGFTLLRQLLIKFGIWQGAGSKSVETEQTNPFSPWKPTFWKQYSSFSYAIDEEEAKNDASIIHGAFKLWTDDFNAIWSVFAGLRTQANISYLADVFAQQYDEDLLQFLTDGGGILPWDGLNESHLKQITDYVKTLPTH